jgi:hypothetical protein
MDNYNNYKNLGEYDNIETEDEQMERLNNEYEVLKDEDKI